MLGRPNQRIENVASPTQRICMDCKERGSLFKHYECRDNIESSLQRDRILTSGYFGASRGNSIHKPKRKCIYGGFAGSSHDTDANKDAPYYIDHLHITTFILKLHQLHNKQLLMYCRTYVER